MVSDSEGPTKSGFHDDPNDLDPSRPSPVDESIVVEFNRALALETENKTLELDTLRSGVARALAEPDRLRYWVAEVEGRTVGQAAITREWSDWRDGWVWWFQSVYVAEDSRGLGVFRALFHAIRQSARDEPDVIGLRLYVEPENHRAQEVYRTLGLQDAGYRVFEDLWPDRFGTSSISKADKTIRE